MLCGLFNNVNTDGYIMHNPEGAATFVLTHRPKHSSHHVTNKLEACSRARYSVWYILTYRYSHSIVKSWLTFANTEVYNYAKIVCQFAEYRAAKDNLLGSNSIRYNSYSLVVTKDESPHYKTVIWLFVWGTSRQNHTHTHKYYHTWLIREQRSIWTQMFPFDDGWLYWLSFRVQKAVEKRLSAVQSPH